METDPIAPSPQRPRALTSRTYVLTRPVYNLRGLANHPERYLIDIYAQPDKAARVWKQRRRKAHDQNWGEGLLALTYNGQKLTHPDAWDDIEWLWGYLLAVVEDYQVQGRGEYTFPNSPTPIVLENRKGATFFTIDDRTAEVDPDVFIRDLVDDAEAFFRWMEQHLGHDISGVPEHIHQLRTHLGTSPPSHTD